MLSLGTVWPELQAACSGSVTNIRAYLMTGGQLAHRPTECSAPRGPRDVTVGGQHVCSALVAWLRTGQAAPSAQSRKYRTKFSRFAASSLHQHCTGDCPLLAVRMRLGAHDVSVVGLRLFTDIISRPVVAHCRTHVSLHCPATRAARVPLTFSLHK
jgi:hypothetical protein